jgi:hypothetical protein
MTQNFIYDQFPSVVNSWGIMHPVSDMPPLLQAEMERGHQPKRTNLRSNLNRRFHPAMLDWEQIGFHYLSVHPLSYPNSGGNRTSSHLAQRLLLSDKHDQREDLKGG